LKPIFGLLRECDSKLLDFVESMGLGVGGRATSLQEPKPTFRPPPPTCGAKKRRKIPETHFRKLYDRDDLPIRVIHKGGYNQIAWKTPCNQLEYKHYLPTFFDGLREKMDPYRFLAILGTFDMIEDGSVEKIYNCIPQLIYPLKRNLVHLELTFSGS
jgi:hypothetical protein